MFGFRELGSGSVPGSDPPRSLKKLASTLEAMVIRSWMDGGGVAPSNRRLWPVHGTRPPISTRLALPFRMRIVCQPTNSPRPRWHVFHAFVVHNACDTIF